VQEIPLFEVLQVRGPAQLSVTSLPGEGAHSFELVTASLVFCVQAGTEGAAWESAVCQALMPLLSSTGPDEEQQGERMISDLNLKKTATCKICFHQEATFS